MRLWWRVKLKSVLLLAMVAACLAALSFLQQPAGSPSSAVSGGASNYRSVHTLLAARPNSSAALRRPFGAPFPS